MAGREQHTNINLLGGATVAGLVDAWNIPIGDGVNAIPTGIWVPFQTKYPGIIYDWTLVGVDASGSMVVDIWKDTLAAFPPVVGDKITASAPPTLSAARTATSSTLTGWTTTFAAGDIFFINVDSVTTIKQALLSLGVKRT